MKSLFDRYDIDANGKIDSKELKRLAEGLMEKNITDELVAETVSF